MLPKKMRLPDDVLKYMARRMTVAPIALALNTVPPIAVAPIAVAPIAVALLAFSSNVASSVVSSVAGVRAPSSSPRVKEVGCVITSEKKHLDLRPTTTTTTATTIAATTATTTNSAEMKTTTTTTKEITTTTT